MLFSELKEGAVFLLEDGTKAIKVTQESDKYNAVDFKFDNISAKLTEDTVVKLVQE